MARDQRHPIQIQGRPNDWLCQVSASNSRNGMALHGVSQHRRFTTHHALRVGHESLRGMLQPYFATTSENWPALLPEPYQLVSLTLVSLTNGLRIRLCKAR